MENKLRELLDYLKGRLSDVESVLDAPGASKVHHLYSARAEELRSIIKITECFLENNC